MKKSVGVIKLMLTDASVTVICRLVIIIPTKEQGGYQGTYYTDRGEESKDLIKAVNLLKGEFDEQN